jgi:hypothetical protein
VRLGLIHDAIKRIGGGISRGYRQLTKEARDN